MAKVNIEERIRMARTEEEKWAWECALNLREQGVESGYRPVIARKECGHEELFIVEDDGSEYKDIVEEIEKEEAQKPHVVGHCLECFTSVYSLSMRIANRRLMGELV